MERLSTTTRETTRSVINRRSTSAEHFLALVIRRRRRPVLLLRTQTFLLYGGEIKRAHVGRRLYGVFERRGAPAYGGRSALRTTRLYKTAA